VRFVGECTNFAVPPELVTVARRPRWSYSNTARAAWVSVAKRDMSNIRAMGIAARMSAAMYLLFINITSPCYVQSSMISISLSLHIPIK